MRVNIHNSISNVNTNNSNMHNNNKRHLFAFQGTWIVQQELMMC